MKRRSRREPNRFLLGPVEFRRDRGLWLERRLELLLDQRAAMRALKIAARLQMLEVATDRHLRHLQVGRQVGDPDRAAGGQRPQDRMAAFSGEHGNAQYQTKFGEFADQWATILLVSDYFCWNMCWLR